MGKTIAMCPVHQLVYDKIKMRSGETMYVRDFYHLVESMRLQDVDLYSQVMKKLVPELRQLGLSPHQIESICNNVKWRVRFSRKDARDIEKVFTQMGLMKRSAASIITIL